MRELLGTFINLVFVGVFQYDFVPPKHALELTLKEPKNLCLFRGNRR